MVYHRLNHTKIQSVPLGKVSSIKRQEDEAERVDYAAPDNSFRNLLIMILSSPFSSKVVAQK